MRAVKIAEKRTCVEERVLGMIAAFAALPVCVAGAYVALAPGVAGRPVLVGTLAVLAGLGISAASLYWAALPLKSIGIAGTAGLGDPPGLSGLLMPRLLTAAAAVAILTVAAAYFVDRLLATSY